MLGRQQQVEDRTDKLAERLGVKRDEAFLRLVHSLVTGQGLAEFDTNDIVDGPGDKGIDAVTFVRIGERVTVYIIQTKFTDGFSATDLLKLRNGLEWIFTRRLSEVAHLQNNQFRDKIDEYRSLLDDVLTPSVSVVAVFATKGIASSRPQEFKQEEQRIRDEYENFGFEKFTLLIQGSVELVDLMYASQKRDGAITAEIRVRYDANVPSIIRYEAEEIKGLICTVAAREIARVVNSDPSGAVFDSNIRQFLGPRGSVNAGIMETCTNTEESHLFWFLNNGITIVCDEFAVNQVSDNPKIKITNMQIVNGCQTASSLAVAETKGRLDSKTRVLLRIYQAPDNQLASRIVETTNNQNRISSRNLKANDKLQMDVQHGFERYGLFYERKRSQYDRQINVDLKRVVPNEAVAQAYMAVVLKEPSVARAHKSVIWDERYSDVFRGGQIEPYVFAWLLSQSVARWLRSSVYYSCDEVVERKMARLGTFFVSRIASFLLRGTDDFKGNDGMLKSHIEMLREVASSGNSTINDAFDLLVLIVRTDPVFSADLDKALKSVDLDRAITQELLARSGQHVKREAQAIREGRSV